MKKAEIELEVITPMFSYGGNSNIAEFRITELKSLMRNTFRELYYFKDLIDMRNKEEDLFGSIDKKSPIIFISEPVKAGRYDKCVMVHNSEKSCLKPSTTVNFSMIGNDISSLKVYIKLLLQASVIGSLGMFLASTKCIIRQKFLQKSEFT